MNCASEQEGIIEEPIYTATKQLMMEYGCYFLNKEVTAEVSKLVINPEKCAVNEGIVGQSADKIAKMVGISVPDGTKILVAELTGVGDPSVETVERCRAEISRYLQKNL